MRIDSGTVIFLGFHFDFFRNVEYHCMQKGCQRQVFCMEGLMLEIKNLAKTFGTKIAVDRLSFTVEDSDIMGFIGKNNNIKILPRYNRNGLRRDTFRRYFHNPKTDCL